MNNAKYVLYDVVDKKEIYIYESTFSRQCKELNTKKRNVREICEGSQKYINYRLIDINKKKERIFTLVDFLTREEFVCVASQTFPIYSGKQLTSYDQSYIQQLRIGTANFRTIQGRLLFIKEKIGLNSIPRSKTKMEDCPEIRKIRLRHRAKERLAVHLRSRIRDIFKENGGTRSKGLKFLLGCERKFFMEYVESLWQVGMSWENYGAWHLDHIRPCASFDLTKEDERNQCFHYTNAQPLWAKDNLSKSSFWNGKRYHYPPAHKS